MNKLARLEDRLKKYISLEVESVMDNDLNKRDEAKLYIGRDDELRYFIRNLPNGNLRSLVEEIVREYRIKN